jgi:hypothetical protein
MPSPAHPFPQFRDVGRMMSAMPAIEGDDCAKRLPPVFGMHITPLPVRLAQRPQQKYPALMQPLQQPQRNLNRQRLCIGKLRPTRFCIRLDRRPVFGQRKPNSHISIHMAVSHMVDQLAHRPAALAIRGVQLSIVQTGYRRTERRRQIRDHGNISVPIGRLGVEPANRVAKVKRSVQRGRCTHALDDITSWLPQCRPPQPLRVSYE